MDTLRFAGKLLLELIPLFLLISAFVYLLVDGLGPARIRALLSGRSAWIGVPLAALLGAATPFCSCSTVPLVHGMRRAGIGTAATIAFLIASPIINPVAVALLWSVIGSGYAVLYTAMALVVAMVGAVVVAAWSGEPARAPAGVAADPGDGSLVVAGRAAGGRSPLSSRVADAFRRSWADLRKLWVPLLAAVAIGAAIHGWVPADLLGRVAGPDRIWAVPAAAVFGLPVYASILVLAPLGAMFLAKGVGVGAVTAFLMGASGFSLPEGILLSRVLPKALLLRTLGVFSAGVVLIGYTFQWLVG